MSRYLLLLGLILFGCNFPSQSEVETKSSPEAKSDSTIQVLKANEEIVIDGLELEEIWSKTKEYPLDQDWIGKPWTSDDFQGSYKLSWSEDYLYVLAKIYDDKLIDIHPDGLDKYWDDDCLEVFIDEDASGGNHQYNYNAFAYHISLDYKVTDIGIDSLPHYYNDHVNVVKTQKGKVTTWELSMRIYNDDFNLNNENNPLVSLAPGKRMGFALAYCDNDFSEEREHFTGSTYIPGEDKNKGWIDAGVFGKIELIK